VEKLFDNWKKFLVLGSNERSKAPEEVPFRCFEGTGSRSEGLQRFIKQFRKKNSTKFAVAISPTRVGP
jgi:hypothetical protein